MGDYACYISQHPDQAGNFGQYGGALIPPSLEGPFREITEAYQRLSRSHEFLSELRRIRRHYQGRPTPVSHAANLSNLIGSGCQIYLKREDLNHTGAHKLNHCMAEVLLAKHMGKTKVIAETGAGQHGVALATAAAYFGLECEIHMGEVDIAKEAPNVTRMKLLGCRVVPVGHGLKTLKEAVDSAFEAYLEDPVNSIASGLDYPGVGPEHSFLKDEGRVQYTVANDRECLEAFYLLGRTEGIIPALESAHALAAAIREAKSRNRGVLLINLSGRGDKDLDFVTENYGFGDEYLKEWLG